MEQALVSQLVIIPLIYYPLFYSVTGAVQGLTIQETIQRVKKTFVPIMIKNLFFWIPCQFGVFRWVDEPLQIPILTVLGLVWTVILSLFAGSAKQPAAAATAAVTSKAKSSPGAATAALQETKYVTGPPNKIASKVKQALYREEVMADVSKSNPAVGLNFGFLNKQRRYSLIPLRSKK